MSNGLDVLESPGIEGAGNSEFKFLARNLVQEAAREPRRQLRHGPDL